MSNATYGCLGLVMSHMMYICWAHVLPHVYILHLLIDTHQRTTWKLNLFKNSPHFVQKIPPPSQFWLIFSKLSTFLLSSCLHLWSSQRWNSVKSTLPVRHKSYVDGRRRHKQSRLTLGIFMEEEEETGAIWIEASGGVEKVFGGVRLQVGGYINNRK